MKRYFLFLLFCCFLQAAAQEAEYTITETELTRLEKISESWEKNKRSQQLQVQSLKAELKKALNKSESLSKQLQTERETLRSLRQSYNEYEKQVSEKIQERQILIDDLKKQGYRLKLALVILSCVLVLLILGSVGFLILKMKLKFLGG